VLATLRSYGATAREMCRVIGGYVAEVVAHAGPKDIKTLKLGCTLDGAPACTWRLTWR
jgi:hypothetical protein